MVTIDTSKLRVSTKQLLGLVGAAGALLQIQAVHDFVIAHAVAHPHVTIVLAMITAAAALLHDPQVQDALGVKHTVIDKKEIVAIAPETLP